MVRLVRNRRRNTNFLCRHLALCPTHVFFGKCVTRHPLLLKTESEKHDWERMTNAACSAAASCTVCLGAKILTLTRNPDTCQTLDTLL